MDIVQLDETVFGHFVLEPGWHWATDVAPIVGTAWCQNRHVGLVAPDGESGDRPACRVG
jgi:hypothetical protein